MMKYIFIKILLISFGLGLKAQSEHELFFYKIKEYYAQSTQGQPNYFEHIPVLDSMALQGKIQSDSLFYLNRLELVNILRKPIPKITIEINDSLAEHKKDSLNEILISQREKFSTEIANKESAAQNLLRNMNDIVHLNEFSEQLSIFLYQGIYIDSTLTHPDFITILSFMDLDEGWKGRIIEDSRATIYSKMRLGHRESVQTISDQFWQMINEEYNSNIADLVALASWIVICDNDDLNREFLKALQSDKIIFSIPDSEGNLKAYSLSYLMINAYNTVYYSKLDYFMRYVMHNPNLIDAMEPYYYYQAISLYFQEEYDQPVSIKARRFLYDTNIKYIE